MSDTRPTPQHREDAITVYADYVCPFCYLGRTSLQRYNEQREAPLEIDWRPFDLRAGKRTDDGEIDHGVDDGKDDEYFEQARQNVERLCEEYDVEMAQTLRRDVDSLPAQLASVGVEREYSYEDWLAFDEAVYDALWLEGRDVGDAEVLADVARDCGLDPDVVTGALDDEALREALSEAFDAARRAGITGVPTFVYGEHAARGAVPPEQLRRLVEGA